MLYSHQLLARKAPLGQIWLSDTLHAKILYYDEVTRLLAEINGAWRTKAVPDPTLLPKGKTKETVTLPENDESDFGDFKQTRNVPKFPNFLDFQQSSISMRSDESNVNDNYTKALSCLQIETLVYACQRHLPHLADGTRAGFFVGDGAGVGKGRTIAGLIWENWKHGRRKALWISVGSDLKYDARRDLDDVGATCVGGGNPTSPQRQEATPQEHGRDVFAEQMEVQNIPDREEHGRPRPGKRALQKATLEVDYEQNILAGPQYQSWLQDASNFLSKGKKRKSLGTITLSMKIAKRMDMPPTLLFEEQGDISYPPQLCELWSKCTQATSETRRPDFCEEQSPGFVQGRMQNHHQTDHHQGSEISSQNLGSPAERLRNTLAGKDGSTEGLMVGSRARTVNNNRQSADISVTPFYSGDDVRSMPITPSARGAGSINIGINSNSESESAGGGEWQTKSRKKASRKHPPGSLIDVFVDLETVVFSDRFNKRQSALDFQKHIEALLQLIPGENFHVHHIHVFAIETDRSEEKEIHRALRSNQRVKLKLYERRYFTPHSGCRVPRRGPKRLLLELELMAGIYNHAWDLIDGGSSNAMMVLSADKFFTEDIPQFLRQERYGGLRVFQQLPPTMVRLPMYIDIVGGPVY